MRACQQATESEHYQSKNGRASRAQSSDGEVLIDEGKAGQRSQEKVEVGQQVRAKCSHRPDAPARAQALICFTSQTHV
jgi:hypothetical protein